MSKTNSLNIQYRIIREMKVTLSEIYIYVCESYQTDNLRYILKTSLHSGKR